jgi:hypothetical protein
MKPHVATTHRSTSVPSSRLSAAFLALALAVAGHAATFVSFQEGDLRTGGDTNAGTTGTVADSGYAMQASYVRADQATTVKDGLQLLAGTQASATARYRTLLGFNVGYLTNVIGTNLSRIDSAQLVLTYDNAGGGTAFGSSVHLTRAFNETTAIWNNPYGDGLDVGGLIGTELRQRSINPASLSPSKAYWGSPGWFWNDGSSGPDGLVQAVRQAMTNADPTVWLLVKRSGEANSLNFVRMQHDGDPDVEFRPEFIVGIDAATNPPVLLSVTAPDATAAEPGANTGTFNIIRSGDTNSEVFAFFYFTGTANNEVDYYDADLGYVVIPAGVTNVSTTIVPIDDSATEGSETVILNILQFDGSGYSLGTPTNATVTILDDLDGIPANTLAAWMLNENNNTAATLSAVAAATNLNPNVLGQNAAAGAGYAPFGANNGTNLHGYGTSQFVSAPSCLYLKASATTNSIAEAIAANDYFSFTLAPTIGYYLNLSGLSAKVRSQAGTNNSVTYTMRSSLDGFGSDLAAFTTLGNSTNWDTLTNVLSVAAFTNLTASVEFRLYVHGDTQSAADFLRVDDVVLIGTTTPLPPGLQQVFVTTPDAAAAEPADTGDFLLTRVGDLSNPLTVYYSVSGTASNGADYTTLTGVTNFAAGSSNVTVRVTPIDDAALEITETVTLTLLADPNYLVASPSAATVTLADDDAQFITVTATDALGSETGPDNAEFTLTRTGNTALALTVFYTVSGTASNGADCVLLSGSAEFPAGITTHLLPVVVSDDGLSEPDETLTLTLSNNPAYFIANPSNATVTIVNDNDPAQFSVAASDDTAYERVPQLIGAFTINRSGGLTNSAPTVLFHLGGSAGYGVDYVASITGSVAFAAGQMSRTINVTSIVDSALEGDETITLTLDPDPGYLIGGASTNVTLVDDELPAETVLWADNFDAGTSAANWSLLFGANNGVADYAADFAYDYSAAGIPPAPGAVTTTGLRLTVNKDATASSAGVNLYPVSQVFTGDYALRFSLFINYHSATNPTEHVLAGLNHSGLLTNRVSQSSGTVSAGDGLFTALSGSTGDNSSFALYTQTNSAAAPARVAVRPLATLGPVFNSPPYFGAGACGNHITSTTKTWIDVEVGQLANVITWKLNNSIIFQYTNTTAFTNGDVMIGYNDQFDSIGAQTNFAVIDNVRVIRLAASVTTPHITHIEVAGGNVQIDFTGNPADLVGAFTIVASANVAGTFAPVGATITSPAPGQFRAVFPVGGGAEFYRIKR